MDSKMLVRFDPQADALYIAFRLIEPGEVARTTELGDGRQVDYSAAGEILGVEFLAVSDGVNLKDVPRAEEISRALRAFPVVSPA